MTGKEGLKQGLLALFALLIFVVLWMLPHRQDQTSAGTTASLSADEKISEAVRIIEAGSNPMQGIVMLREVLKEDPENVKAIRMLGYFSLMSGQAEKAEARFREVLQLEPEDHEAWFFLGDAMAMQKDTTEAKRAYETFIRLSKDAAAIQKAEDALRSLKN